MTKALVIFNPYAGRGRGVKRAEAVVAALQAVDFEFDSVVSENRGHAVELAERGSGGRSRADRGGWRRWHSQRGSEWRHASETAGPGDAAGRHAHRLGQRFCRRAGHSYRPAARAEILKRGNIRRIDIGKVNGRYFANNVGIGFEAQVNIEAHKMTWLKGQMMYLAAILRSDGQLSPPRRDNRQRWPAGRGQGHPDGDGWQQPAHRRRLPDIPRGRAR